MSTVPVNANMTVAGLLTASGVLRDKGGFTHNVKAYGAVGDGVTNDQPAIQAAIDASKDTNQLMTDNGGLTTPGIIVLPPGRYLLNAPLRLWSGQTLRGVGPAAHLVAGAGFSGTSLVLLSAPAGYCTRVRVEDLDFESTTTWAVANDTTVRTVNCLFQRLNLNTPYGIALSYYAQACTVTDIYSYGPIEQILHLRGNFNFVRNVDKEGDTGTSTDPYIFVEAHGFTPGESVGNHLELLLLEGVCSANKTLITLNGTSDTVLHHLWFEATATDGYAVRILNSFGRTTFTGTLHGVSATQKIQVANCQQVYIDRLDTDTSDIEWHQRLTVDSVSQVTIGSHLSRSGGSLALLSRLPNVRIQESFVRAAYTAAGPLLPLAVPLAGTSANLLTNPSFESSGTGWTVVGSPTTAEYIASEVGPGLMAHYAWGAVQGSAEVTQPVTIPASWVGKPLLFSALVKVTTTNGLAHPYLFGAGITGGPVYNYLNGGEGWGIVQQVIVPQSAGTLTAGVRALSMSEFAVDAMSLTFGTEGAAHIV